MVIDFHSHILPGIDDGSKDVATSVQMLQMTAEQGVDVIIATPHFYADKDRVERFLEKRRNAYEALQEKTLPGSLRILCGAEVAFFRGISRAEKLDELTIAGTDVLLLEMPFMPWESSDIKEVEYLVRERGFRVLLAHLERYPDLPGNRHRVEEILELPVKVQINAGSLLDWKRRGRLVRWFRDGQAQVLGSDCHGIHHRLPNLAEGRKTLEKKLGAGFLQRVDQAGSELLQIK